MKEPKHYIECGYEDVGYQSADLTSSEIYPDYIEEEVKRCVREIQSHQTADTVTMAFMTDLHLALSYNHKIRMQRTVNSYKEIAKRVHIDKLLLGGDFTNEGCKEYKSDCYRELRAHFDGLRYYPVNGNHDDGTIWDKAYIQADKSTNHLTQEERYRLFYNHLPSIGAEFDENNKALYYLVNEKETKTRYICLDTVDVPFIYDENGKLKYHGQWLFAVSQAQLDWLINTALKFDEEGWSIVFTMHGMPYPGDEKTLESNLFKRLTVLMDVIDAYKKGDSIKGTYNEGDFERTVDADFSAYTRGDITALLIGDYHTDKVVYSNAKVPYIFTANAVMYYVGGPTQVPRRNGDKSEILYDIMVLDKKERKFYITRIGAGEDRVVEY